jgi:hypothetical protein
MMVMTPTRWGPVMVMVILRDFHLACLQAPSPNEHRLLVAQQRDSEPA